MTVRLLRGDCRDLLRSLADESVHCVVSSPPYFGLRDYGTGTWEGGDPACDHVVGEMRRGLGLANSIAATRGGGHKADETPNILARSVCPKCSAIRIDRQIGLEDDPQAFVAEIVGVMREVRRVLRRDGSLWLNMGDSYAGGGRGGQIAASGLQGSTETQDQSRIAMRNMTQSRRRDDAPIPRSDKKYEGLRAKNLMGMPWRIAFAMQDDGWWLREEIIWHKPNPMPESAEDRCTKSHEQLFHFTKAERYYFDAVAIAEESIYAPGKTTEQEREKGYYAGKWTAPSKGKRNDGAFKAIRKTGNKRSVWTIASEPFTGEFCTGCRTYFAGEQLNALRVERYLDADRRKKRRHCSCGRHDAWLSHFAVFPSALVEPCILATTSERGCCGNCGAPWTRQVEKQFVPQPDVCEEKGIRDGMDVSNGWEEYPRGHTEAKTVGWMPSCHCGEDYIPMPCTVLDPFGGAGTTGLVADRLQRNSVLVELNPDYADMIEQRIRGSSPLFAKVAR